MIQSLKLENFVAFQQTQITFAGLTLLTGTNSAGKSSVLHALALLRQTYETNHLSGPLVLNGEYVNLGVGRDVLHSEFRPLASDDIVRLAVSLEADEQRATWRAIYSREADALALDEHMQPLERGLFGPAFQFLGADRMAPETTYPKSHEAVHIRRSLGVRGEHAPNFLRVHGSEAVTNSSLIHPSASGPSLAEQANAWLAELSPETSFTVVDIPDADLVKLVYRRLGTDVATEPQRATNVGFGLTVALPIITACLSAAQGSLIVIENPEAHLHPRGQAMIGRMCALAAAGGAQVVVESHSDHVLNAVRLEVKRKSLSGSDVSLNYFSREAKVLQPIVDHLQVDDDGMIASWPPGFFDQIDVALDALLR
ncbi:MAG: DUF3696 domain-containing protein [Patulibacter sp.]|nr:DUF3696 domain-containing protein [Patulibacter sp.]